MPNIVQLTLDQVRIDGTQTRVALNEEAATDYAAAYKARAKMPPLVAFYDGADYWLADGFHRFFGLRRIKWDKPVRFEVHEGVKRDAIRYGFTANDAHGQRRTNADKRKAVEIALADEEWSSWSDGAIGELCGVSQSFASKMRREQSAISSGQNGFNLNGTQDEEGQELSDSEPAETRTGRDGKEYPVREKPEPESGRVINNGSWDEATEAVKNAGRLIRDAIKAIKAFEDSGASAWLLRTSGKSQVRIGLDKALADLNASGPADGCDKCDAGCDHCRNTGWLPRYMVTKNAKSGRAEE
ncbi:MAG: hypothetical protein IPK85_03380 [Gemmatimonadetes bacterium]|nr:hypothetical protein [Gemmatimonadota bacterium]